MKAHFAIFFKNEKFLRLDNWDGDTASLPGQPEDIERIALIFDDDWSALDFVPEDNGH